MTGAERLVLDTLLEAVSFLLENEIQNTPKPYRPLLHKLEMLKEDVEYATQQFKKEESL